MQNSCPFRKSGINIFMITELKRFLAQIISYDNLVNPYKMGNITLVGYIFIKSFYFFIYILKWK